MSRTSVLTTTTVTYLELIGNGKIYHVPPYQRDYAWTEEEWEDLWNDVLDLRGRPGARHYMGALVVKGDSDRELTIIDGQQRLATISVLSLAIIDKLQRIADRGVDTEHNRERARGLRNRFVGEKDPASLIESSRLNLSRADDAFYQDYLVQLRSPLNPRGLTRFNALLWRCFEYFSRQLDTLDDVRENGEALAGIMSESVARHLLFILITVEDELGAYTVFETLNARGLELTTADLLKNYLFSRVRVPTDLDALQRRWHALIATVTPERFSEFLRYHLLCEHPRIRKERLFKLIRDRIDTPHQVFDLIEALERRAELYAALADASHEYWRDRPEARHYVRDLILFRSRQVTPVLFAAWERLRNDFDRVLKLAGDVSFRYLVSRRNPNALEPVCHEAAKAILDGNASRPRAVFAHLRPVYVDDGAFESSFAVYSIDPRGRRKLLKYILCRLEDDANGVGRERPRDGPRIDRAHSPAESFRRLDGRIRRDRGTGGGRTDRQRNPARGGRQPRHRGRAVCRQASCIRTERLCADPASRGNGTRGLVVLPGGETPAAPGATGRARVAGGFRLTSGSTRIRGSGALHAGNDVHVLGGSAVRFARRRDGSSWRDWVREAGLGALADAGIEPRDVDAVVVATESDFFSLQLAPGPVVAAELGLEGCGTMRAESGGASGAVAVRAAHALVASGLARCVLVVGFEAVASRLGGDDVRMLYGMSFDAEVEGFAGATPAALYALSMRMHMARHGTTADQLAAVAVANRANACANPLAHKPMRIEVSDVLASPLVASPYRRLDCSLLSDGAAAVVVAHPSRAPRIERPRVRIAGSGAATDAPRLGDRTRPDRFDAKARAARDAYAMAGVRAPAGEIDCAEVYDAFSGAQIQAVEALGFTPEGAGGAACAAGEFDGEGRIPVNLSGGLLGQGGAPGATGVVQAMTVQRLLEGRYFEGAQPRRDLRRGVVDTHGGVCTSAVVQVFEATG